MLSLFGTQKTSSRTPKPAKKEESSFDFDSFIHKVNSNSKEDQNVNQQKEIEKLLDVSCEPRKAKPAVSKATQKMLQKVDNQYERVPKEIEKVSKRITNSLKQFVSSLDHSKPRTTHNRPLKKDATNQHNTTVKPRSDPERLKYMGSSYEDQGSRLLLNPGTKDDYHNRKSSINSSPKTTPNRRMSKDDIFGEFLKRPQDFERPRLLSKDKHSEKKNEDDMYYNPLESSPCSLKSDSEWKANPIEKHEKYEKYEKYEQYNPLDVSLKKTQGVQGIQGAQSEPGRLAGRELVSLTAKRPMKGDAPSKFETDLMKKVKLDEQGRKEAHKMMFKESKKMAQMSKPHSAVNNKGYREDVDDFEEADVIVDGVEYEEDDNGVDNEAMKEFNKMMGRYRAKIQNRRDNDADSSDMEAGFEEIDREDRISRKIAEREDREQLRFIELEEMRERRGKTH